MEYLALSLQRFCREPMRKLAVNTRLVRLNTYPFAPIMRAPKRMKQSLWHSVPGAICECLL